jgi:hypothetical protein
MKSLSPVWSIREFISHYPQFTSIFILISAALLGVMISPIFDFLGESHQNLLLVLLIGLLAATLSVLLHLPVWWVRINAGFTLCLYLFWSLEIPTYVYLFAFIAFLGVYWNTIITRVPYYPSKQEVWEEVEKLFPQDQSFNVLEIGSGLGGFSRYLSKRHVQAQFVGLETAPVPWLMSRLLAVFEQAPCQFKRQNYQNISFNDFDFIYAFLSPAAMPQLLSQVKTQLNTQATVISYMFNWPISEKQAIQTILMPNGESLYIYHGMKREK